MDSSFALAAIIFWILVVVELVPEGIRIRSNRRLQGQIGVKSTTGKPSRLVILAGPIILLIFAIDLWFGYTQTAPLPVSFLYLGVLLALLGITVRQWALATLGRFFFPQIEFSSDHRLITKGPYRLIRHPSYTGATLTFLGLALIMQSWGAVAVTVVYLGVFLGSRIFGEERALKKEFGKEYEAYAKRTKRLIPFLF